MWPEIANTIADTVVFVVCFWLTGLLEVQEGRVPALNPKMSW